MTNTKTHKIIIGVIITLIIAIAIGLAYTSNKDKEAQKIKELALLQQQEQQAILDKQKAESEAEENKLIAQKELDDMLKEKENNPEPSSPESKPQDEQKPTDKVTTDKDGNITIDKEYKEPTPPPAPKPEGPTNNPNSKPEYKPEDTKKPPADTIPKDGTTRVNNGKNEIYVGGFGWIENHGGGVNAEIVDNSGWENSDRIGH